MDKELMTKVAAAQYLVEKGGLDVDTAVTLVKEANLLGMAGGVLKSMGSAVKSGAGAVGRTMRTATGSDLRTAVRSRGFTEETANVLARNKNFFAGRNQVLRNNTSGLVTPKTYNHKSMSGSTLSDPAKQMAKKQAAPDRAAMAANLRSARREFRQTGGTYDHFAHRDAHAAMQKARGQVAAGVAGAAGLMYAGHKLSSPSTQRQDMGNYY